MLNIETRQNDKFVVGYPYNHAVDSIFEPLNADLISAYNLNQDEINEINDYKNRIYIFDDKLHKFLFELSAFVMSFDSTGLEYQKEYDTLKIARIKLEDDIDILKEKYTNLLNEFNFISDSINVIGNDNEKLKEIIQFYKNKIVAVGNTFDITYISNLTNDISIVTNTIHDTILQLDYHKTEVLDKTITDYLQYVSYISKYSFSEINIRSLYEAWISDGNSSYYTNLINYFKDEYESAWTYGSSLIFSENLEHVDANKIVMTQASEYIGSLILKRNMFEIELDVKEIVQNFVTTHTTYKDSDLDKLIHVEKRKALEIRVMNILNELNKEKTNLRLIVSKKQEQDYFMYQELIIEKRRYIYSNINMLDSQELEKIDNQISALEVNYSNVKVRFESSLYWHHYCLVDALNMAYNEILKERKSIENWFNSTPISLNKDESTEIENKISFYEDELTTSNDKLLEMIQIRDKLDVEVNLIKDDMTLINSILFENIQIKNTLSNTYTNNFIERLAFFTQDINDSVSSSVFVLLDNNFYRDLHKQYDSLKNYTSNISLINVDLSNMLFTYYENVLNKIYICLEKQWKIEFDHEILSHKKYDYYKEYFDSKLRMFYATIHNFFNIRSYSTTIYVELKNESDKIEEIFDVYLSLAFVTKKDIEVNTDIYNYDNSLLFVISEGIETKENVISTFETFISNVLLFVYNSNEKFKVDIENKEQIEDINLLWDDMGSTNV